MPRAPRRGRPYPPPNAAATATAAPRARARARPPRPSRSPAHGRQRAWRKPPQPARHLGVAPPALGALSEHHLAARPAERARWRAAHAAPVLQDLW
ncbi:hypothetical protein FGB62_203g035 [Gracilaria domingensis]|nr:hypothetical protein FGB62_203g035 [Gracilaria domingensis]